MSGVVATLAAASPAAAEAQQMAQAVQDKMAKLETAVAGPYFHPYSACRQCVHVCMVNKAGAGSFAGNMHCGAACRCAWRSRQADEDAEGINRWQHSEARAGPPADTGVTDYVEPITPGLMDAWTGGGV